eukprot:2515906-Pyramimonas_sp.AAC.1
MKRAESPEEAGQNGKAPRKWQAPLGRLSRRCTMHFLELRPGRPMHRMLARTPQGPALVDVR